MLDDCLKLTAFNLTNKDPNGSLFPITSEAYRFDESAHLFDDYVRKLIEEHKYATAAQVAQHTGLCDESFLEGFALPLSFSREKANYLYNYLNSATGTSLKVPFMRLLDTMMRDEKEGDSLLLRQRMAKYKGIPAQNFNYDYLRKNIPKLRKSLHLAMDATPFSSHAELISALVFKVMFWIKKLIEGQTSEEERIQKCLSEF